VAASSGPGEDTVKKAPSSDQTVHALSVATQEADTQDAPSATEDKSTARQVPAVRRALAILFQLGSAPRPATLTRISKEVGALPSTCLHILRELVHAGLVSFDPDTKTYALGSRVLTLANQYGRRNRFVEVARPHMESVARQLGLEVTAHECDGLGHIVVVAGTEIVEDMQLRIPPGQRVPLLAGASGRLIGATHDMPESTLRELFGRVRWQRPLSYEQWQTQVQEAHACGFGIDEGWSRPGITMIAVPIPIDTSPPKRFIGAIGVSHDLSSNRRGTVVAALQAAAARMAGALA
jgi:DNA-binding IclR family transcriptional regulator